MSSSLVATPPLAQRLRGVASSPVRDLLALLDRPQVISFAGGLPAPELFDLDGVRAAYDAVLWGPHARRSLQYAPTDGDRELRARLAGRLTARGMFSSVDDLLVTSGSQQALSLLSTAVLDPGAVVVVVLLSRVLFSAADLALAALGFAAGRREPELTPRSARESRSTGTR